MKLAKEDFSSATNAYLRPETSEGAKVARQQTILQPSDETQA